MQLNNCEVRMTVTTSSVDGEYISIYLRDRDSLHEFLAVKIPKDEAFNLYNNRAASCAASLSGLNVVGKNKTFMSVVMEDVSPENFEVRLSEWLAKNPGWIVNCESYNWRKCTNGKYTTTAHKYFKKEGYDELLK